MLAFEWLDGQPAWLLVLFFVFTAGGGCAFFSIGLRRLLPDAWPAIVLVAVVAFVLQWASIAITLELVETAYPHRTSIWSTVGVLVAFLLVWACILMPAPPERVKRAARE